MPDNAMRGQRVIDCASDWVFLMNCIARFCKNTLLSCRRKRWYSNFGYHNDAGKDQEPCQIYFISLSIKLQGLSSILAAFHGYRRVAYNFALRKSKTSITTWRRCQMPANTDLIRKTLFFLFANYMQINFFKPVGVCMHTLYCLHLL